METVTTYSIVIPTLGNHPVFFDALASVESHLPADSEVLVVCNAPAADAKLLGERVAARFPGFRYLITPRPYGIARAYNLGAREARGGYVVFMHDDVLIHSGDWLGRLRDVLDARPDAGMAGGSEAKFMDRSAGEFPPFWKDAVECDWSPTISMTRRAQIAGGCLFDEFYEIGLEDMDWALSFRRKGLKVVHRPVAHTHVGTKGSYTLFLENKPLLDYYSREGVRERYFADKNRDVLSGAFIAARMARWGRRDRDWRKTWWMKLYLRYYLHHLLKTLRLR
jgi:glycosyltransferase involved in cell wall biosynthesis